MTEKDLALVRELVELASKATPKEWGFTKHGNSYCHIERIYNNGDGLGNKRINLFTLGNHPDQQEKDCQFIAASRNAIPAIEALLNQREVLLGYVETLANTHDRGAYERLQLLCWEYIQAITPKPEKEGGG